LQEAIRDSREGAAGEPSRPETLTDWLRARFSGVIDPVARRLGGIGISPDAISILGFLLQIGVGTLFWLGRIRLGGMILFFGAPLDALDGAVARANGKDGQFGAFLDSTLDRLADAVLILGLTAHRIRAGAHLDVALLLAALVASFMVSYTRARAESLGVSCKVGLLTRLERILLIAALAAVGLTTALAWALAVLSTVTVVQRIVHVHHRCTGGD
jgi:CDP-diacylglycerol--glycerol-3-phosphate 3-phosphatidyltransferase